MEGISEVLRLKGQLEKQLTEPKLYATFAWLELLLVSPDLRFLENVGCSYLHVRSTTIAPFGKAGEPVLTL